MASRSGPAVVVALGTVDPALVCEPLRGHATFVTDQVPGATFGGRGPILAEHVHV
jgi:hypothetical protein